MYDDKKEAFKNSLNIHSIQLLKSPFGSRYRAMDPNLAKIRVRNPPFY